MFLEKEEKKNCAYIHISNNCKSDILIKQTEIKDFSLYMA